MPRFPRWRLAGGTRNGSRVFRTLCLSSIALVLFLALKPLTVRADPPVAVDDAYSADEDNTLNVAAPGVLENDHDSDQDPLSAVLVSGVSDGTLMLNVDGSFTYTPTLNYDGLDSFRYKANDGTGDSNVATVDITVNPVNDVPWIDPSVPNPSADEDEDIVIDLTAHENDVESSGTGLDWTVSGLDGCTVSGENSDNDVLTFTPAPNFYGSDTVLLTLSDPQGLTATQSITLTWNGVNDDPVLAGLPDQTLDEDVPLDNAIDLWAYASDVETADSGLTFTIDNAPNANAGVSIDGNRYIDIQPAADWSGSTSVRIRVTDPEGASDVDTFAVTVNPVNDAPWIDPAVPNPSAVEDTDILIDLTAYENDVESSGSSLDWTVSGLDNCTVSGENSYNDELTFTPSPDFDGSDTVLLTLSDPQGLTATQSITLTWNGVNDDPVLAGLPDQTLDEDVPLDNAIDLWAYASDVETADSGLTFTIDNAPNANAGVSIDGNRYIDIQPAANWSGSTSVRIRVTDPQSASDVDTFAVTVNPVNDDPQAGDDSFTVDEDSDSNSLNVRENDTYLPDAYEALTIFSVTGASPGQGEVSISGDLRRVIYTPQADYYGPDIFVYTIIDGNGGVATATVTVTVQGINDPPVAVNDVASTQEDVPVVIDVLRNDYDIQNEGGLVDSSRVDVVSYPGDGQVVTNTLTGAITYTPNQNWNGTDLFTYRVWDYGAPGDPEPSNIATVSVTAEPVNDPPIADAGPDQSVLTNALVTLDGSGSYDPDGDPQLSYLWIQTGGISVALSDSTAATPTFTAPGDPGPLTFELTVIDSERRACEVPDEVVIIVNNQPPVAGAGSDQGVDTGTQVTLDGSGSYDPDDDYPLTHYWAQVEGPRVNLSDLQAESPTFTAPNTPAELTFRLYVIDFLELPASPPFDEVAVHVGNQPPVADAGGDQSVDTNDRVTLDGSGSDDPDNDEPLTYLWTQTGGIIVTLSNPYTATTTFTAPDDPTSLTFALFVTDSLGQPADPISDEVSIAVNNQPPVADAGPDRQVGVKTLVTLDGIRSDDPDGDKPLTYHWTQTGGLPLVTLSNPYAATTTFVAPGEETALTFALHITDSFGLPALAPDEVVITAQAFYAYLPSTVKQYLVAPDLKVQAINATSNDVQLVILNQGNGAVDSPFWIDAYIDPHTLPTGVNQPWWEYADQGISWRVSERAFSALPPGGSLTLAVGDDYYQPHPGSRVNWPLAAGTTICAQVDSWNLQTNYGMLLELDESNNIACTLLSTAATSVQGVPSAEREEPIRPNATPVRR